MEVNRLQSPVTAKHGVNICNVANIPAADVDTLDVIQVAEGEHQALNLWT